MSERKDQGRFTLCTLQLEELLDANCQLLSNISDDAGTLFHSIWPTERCDPLFKGARLLVRGLGNVQAERGQTG